MAWPDPYGTKDRIGLTSRFRQITKWQPRDEMLAFSGVQGGSPMYHGIYDARAITRKTDLM